MKAVLSQERIKARLVLVSTDVPPEEISAYFGITPTRMWVVGQPYVPKATKLHDDYGWVLICENATEIYAVRVVEQLLSMVPQDKLIGIESHFHGRVSVELSLVIHMSAGRVPSISLSSEQIALLAATKACFDVDIYVLDRAEG
jgi:hypothetical protein